MPVIKETGRMLQVVTSRLASLPDAILSKRLPKAPDWSNAFFLGHVGTNIHDNKRREDIYVSREEQICRGGHCAQVFYDDYENDIHLHLHLRGDERMPSSWGRVRENGNVQFRAGKDLLPLVDLVKNRLSHRLGLEIQDE